MLDNIASTDIMLDNIASPLDNIASADITNVHT